MRSAIRQSRTYAPCSAQLGPVAVFGASNFPLAFSVAGGDTASALAAGNPSYRRKRIAAHPGTSELAGLHPHSGRCIRATFPAGARSHLLFDAGTRVGSALVQHPLLRAVGFTGSFRGGRALMNLAAAAGATDPGLSRRWAAVNPVFILPKRASPNAWRSPSPADCTVLLLLASGTILHQARSRLS